MNDCEKHILVPGIVYLANDENNASSYIPIEVLNEIKKQDSKPLFAVMAIGHEGDSAGKLYEDNLSIGKELKQWFKQLWPIKAVKQLVSLMKEKTYIPIFEKHAVGNNSQMRIAVGNIVAATRKIIDNVNYAIGIAYINNFATRQKLLDGEYDSCSLEANCVFERAENALRYVVKDVKDLLGIALCNTDEDKTGFPDAHILAVVTAMAKNNDNDDTEKGRSKMITLKDVKEFIKENVVSPEMLFTIQELITLPKVTDAFKNELQTELSKKNTEISELKVKLQPLLVAEVRAKVAKLVRESEMLKDENKSIVEYLARTIIITIEDKKKEELKTEVDNKIKENLELLRETGVEIKAKDNKNNLQSDKDKYKSQEDKDISSEDLSSVINNPLIPGYVKK